MLSATETRLPCRIARFEKLNDAIVEIEIQAENKTPLPEFTAGSHIDLHLPGGLVRQYSLCSAPSDTHAYRIAVLREEAGRGGSEAVHTQLKPGDAVTISAPRNLFPCHDSAKAVFIAGGIGITPLLCMVRERAASGHAFELHYSVSQATRLVYRETLQALCKTAEQRVRFYADDAAPTERLDLDLAIPAFDHDTHLYVCGPAGLIDATLAKAASIGWPETHLHSERFQAPQPPATEIAPGEFLLSLQGEFENLHVPAGKSILQVLKEAGADVPASCEQGICGTCCLRVVEGEPDHRDYCLNDKARQEQGLFAPCCSRAHGAHLTLARV